jgi:preprotein translocase subunit SecE
MTNLPGKVRQYWNETVSEVWTKSTWPTPKELAESTLVVVVAICLLGVFVFVADFSLHGLVQFLSDLVAKL